MKFQQEQRHALIHLDTPYKEFPLFFIANLQEFPLALVLYSCLIHLNFGVYPWPRVTIPLRTGNLQVHVSDSVTN